MKPSRSLAIYLEDLIKNYQAEPKGEEPYECGELIDEVNVIGLDQLEIIYHTGKKFMLDIREVN